MRRFKGARTVGDDVDVLQRRQVGHQDGAAVGDFDSVDHAEALAGRGERGQIADIDGAGGPVGLELDHARFGTRHIQSGKIDLAAAQGVDLQLRKGARPRTQLLQSGKINQRIDVAGFELASVEEETVGEVLVTCCVGDQNLGPIPGDQAGPIDSFVLFVDRDNAGETRRNTEAVGRDGCVCKADNLIGVHRPRSLEHQIHAIQRRKIWHLDVAAGDGLELGEGGEVFATHDLFKTREIDLAATAIGQNLDYFAAVVREPRQID